MKLQTLQVVLAIFCCLVFFSCRQKEGKQSVSYRYSLQETGQILSYESDKPIMYRISTVFPYTDKTGHKYLTFQETDLNTIQIYEMHTGKHYKTVEIAREGPDGIAHPSGYYIRSFDEIYFTNAMLPFIARSDTSGRIFQKIGFEKTDEGELLIPIFKSGSIFWKPLVILNDTFYVAQGNTMQGREPDTWPVSCYIDTTNKSVKALPFNFPSILKDDELRKVVITSCVYSRCYDGSRFVYSFYLEETVAVASPDHREVQKIPAKSKYVTGINPREKRPADMIQYVKRQCEAPFYGNLIHDPYRNVYYRIAYPETEMEELEVRTYIDIWTTGRKRFSIIILDKDFNVIGETLFPDYKYCSMNMFVEEEGLYIRSNHCMDPDFEEDKLMFTCFELKKD